MALPNGITTATVTAGVPLSFGGAQLKQYVTITPSVYLVHTATGTPLVNFLEEISSEAGVAAQFTLPHTDQDGFQDEAGNAYKNWYYTANFRYTDGVSKTYTIQPKTFQIASGQTLVDIDLLPSGVPAIPYAAPVAAVTSVGGLTGAVTGQDIAGLQELSATYASASAVAAKLDKTEAANTYAQKSDLAGVNATPAGTVILDGTPHLYTDTSRPLYPVNEIVVAGDSYAASDGGIISSSLASSLGVPTYNYGIGGNTTTDVAIRLGGIVPLITFTGGVIPADTSAVAVTVQPSGDYINAGAGGNPYTYVGTIAGIAGNLVYSTALSQWTFARAAAGTQTTIPANTPFLITTPTYKDRVIILLDGFNNRFAPVGDMRNVVRDIDAVINALTPIHKRYMVSAHFTTVAETRGTSGYNMTTAANAAKAARYGALYYDVRRDFIDQGLTLASITPTQADLNAIAADTVPPSLMNAAGDHPNAAGYGVIAKLWGRWIGARGWGMSYNSINKLTADQASFETSVNGWTGNGDGNIVIARSTLYAADGTASMEVTAAPSGISNVTVKPGSIAVTPGQYWAASIESRAGVTPRQRNIDMYWYKSDGSFLQWDPGTKTTDTVTGWTRHTKTGTVAPANAAFLRIGLASTGAVGGEKHYIDKAGAYIVASAGAAAPNWELP